MHAVRSTAAAVLLAAALVGGGAATAFAADETSVTSFRGLQLPAGHQLGEGTDVLVTYTFRGVTDSVRLHVGEDLGSQSFLSWSAVPGLPTDSCVTSVILDGDAEPYSVVGRAPVCGVETRVTEVVPTETVVPPTTVVPPETVVPPTTVVPPETVVPPTTVVPTETVVPPTTVPVVATVPWTTLVTKATAPVEPTTGSDPRPVALTEVPSLEPATTETVQRLDGTQERGLASRETTADHSEQLAHTGSEAWVFAVAGAVLVAAGAALMVARRSVARI